MSEELKVYVGEGYAKAWIEQFGGLPDYFVVVPKIDLNPQPGPQERFIHGDGHGPLNFGEIEKDSLPNTGSYLIHLPSIYRLAVSIPKAFQNRFYRRNPEKYYADVKAAQRDHDQTT